MTLFYIGFGVIAWLSSGLSMWVARLVFNAMFECGLRTDRLFRDILCGLISFCLILDELQKGVDGKRPLTPMEAALLEEPPGEL